MHEYEFVDTGYGVKGFMPSGEEREFATESEYLDAYTDEENEIYDEMYRLNNGFQYEIEEDFVLGA